MGFTPFMAGDGRLQTHTFTTDSGIFPLTGLSNGALALHLEDIYNNNTLYVCSGTWLITNAAGGVATFTPSPADLTPPTGYLGRPGVYKLYPVVTLSTGPVPMDAQIIQVTSQP